MKAFDYLLLGVALVASHGLVRADEKIDKAKLVGDWKLVKSNEIGGPPKGASFKFTKDGKLVIEFDLDGPEKHEGAYAIEGDKLIYNARQFTVPTLTDEKLIIEHKEGAKFELERVKKK
ncbi:MAG TPA: hypothetical protein VKS79_21740 [Gemmataceae bacterium]|nr:hypothetical protein [Gemmataceae bacterium]